MLLAAGFVNISGWHTEWGTTELTGALSRPDDAAVRETLEETGLQVRATGVMGAGCTRGPE